MIEYLCRDCLVASSCTMICDKFTDRAVDILYTPPNDEELPILYKELKKQKRCILCRKDDVIMTIHTTTTNTSDKTIGIVCNFCDTIYIIKQTKDTDYLDDVYWEFHDSIMDKSFSFSRLFKDLGIE